MKKCEKCGFPAEYELDNELFCSDCILKIVGIERRENITYNYYLNDDYYGNNEDDDELLLIQNINENVKEIEED